MESVGIAILAAGKGTRLKIDLAKALCPALGRPLVDHVVIAAKKFAASAGLKCSLTAVVGHKKDEVEGHLKKQFADLLFHAGTDTLLFYDRLELSGKVIRISSPT